MARRSSRDGWNAIVVTLIEAFPCPLTWLSEQPGQRHVRAARRRRERHTNVGSRRRHLTSAHSRDLALRPVTSVLRSPTTLSMNTGGPEDVVVAAEHETCGLGEVQAGAATS
jgi:hypothetical protein